MNPLVLLLLLILNFGISFRNAYAAGMYFTESKLTGGWERILIWCALIMSACGFTWVYLALITMGAVGFNFLSPGAGEVMFQLGYIIIILPVLGSGLAIWADSLVKAYRRRTFGDIAVAGWNTFAMAQNTIEAASEAPNALRSVMDFFSESDSDDEGGFVIVVILLVIVALGAGAITTALIARWADRRHTLDIVASW